MTDTPSSDETTPSPDGATDSGIAEKAAQENVLVQPMRDTHFDFQHKVFSLPGAFFCQEPNSKEAVLNILLGDLKAALAFPTLMESFQIEEGSHDARLLEIIEQGLAFVKQIRPGEEIPGELLDGRASWSVEDKHRIIAKGRLTVQIVSSFTGNEIIVSDQSELEQLVEDPQTKEKMKAAFAKIAERLKLTTNAEQYLTDRIDDLAQELSYIEALRDRFRHIRRIDQAMAKLATIYRTDRTFCSELNRMQGLIRKPVREYDMIFDQADAQTGDIVGALRNFHPTIQFIRKIRDDLRAKLLEWEELLQGWDEVTMERSPKVEALQKQTYRFLASRYIETTVWKRGG
ncbi:hypothetical protein TSH7_08115 [Azospirillum sp. TSH7]|uniref:hypothetical protein n=1 Tax=unclassified Azospirillum TaxID=2630922 RepID=UPI000D615922|nr:MULTISPECIES: hypothetical protein [unclassified Azospirillum]PWC59654.1 hypothetical protein TSH20_27380 [Azospirillum sp. TSH20]PWC65714.1 hypothetical protein TSH7_08115 [Azospirillum sp. TSH7]